MNKVFSSIFGCLLGSFSYAQPEFPSNPVIGVIGGSFGSCHAPEESILKGVGFSGCSHEPLDKKLTKNRILDKKGVRVESVAQGGAVTYDIPNQGYLGYQSQIQKLQVRTSWFDGVQRLQYTIFSVVSDCLHNRGTQTGAPCTSKDIESMVGRIHEAASYALKNNITPVINAYPRYEDLDLETVRQAFGLDWVVDENGYNAIASAHENALSEIPGVIYVKPWERNFETIDGLHPKDKSVVSGAKVIAKAILKYEKNK